MASSAVPNAWVHKCMGHRWGAPVTHSGSWKYWLEVDYCSVSTLIELPVPPLSVLSSNRNSEFTYNGICQKYSPIWKLYKIAFVFIDAHMILNCALAYIEVLSLKRTRECRPCEWCSDYPPEPLVGGQNRRGCKGLTNEEIALMCSCTLET